MGLCGLVNKYWGSYRLSWQQMLKWGRYNKYEQNDNSKWLLFKCLGSDQYLQQGNYLKKYNTS